MSLILKISFCDPINMNNSPQTFTENEYYTFTQGTDATEMEFLGYSRIDGNCIFRLPNLVGRLPINRYNYNGNDIDEVSITNLGDNLVKYRHLKDNKDQLLTFLMEHHNITDEDLLDPDVIAMIKREIRLEKILGN